MRARACQPLEVGRLVPRPARTLQVQVIGTLVLGVLSIWHAVRPYSSCRGTFRSESAMAGKSEHQKADEGPVTTKRCKMVMRRGPLPHLFDLQLRAMPSAGDVPCKRAGRQRPNKPASDNDSGIWQVFNVVAFFGRAGILSSTGGSGTVEVFDPVVPEPMTLPIFILCVASLIGLSEIGRGRGRCPLRG